MIYDNETGRFFETDFAMKNYKGVVDCLKRQKPVSKEEAIAQVQRIKAASQRKADN